MFMFSFSPCETYSVSRRFLILVACVILFSFQQTLDLCARGFMKTGSAGHHRLILQENTET